MLRWIIVAIVLGMSLPAAASDVAASAVPPSVSRQAGYVQTPDGQLYYEIYGAGPTIILLAGGPGSSHVSLRPEFDQLAEKHTVVYFDNAGRGRSSDLPVGRHHSPYRDAQDVEYLREALGIEKFALIGHSYGGRPAMVYAVRHPERLSHLVLSSSGYGHESSQRNIDAVNRFVASQYPEIWVQLLEMKAKGIRTCDPRYQELYGSPIAQLYWHDPSKKQKRVRISTDPRDSLRLAVYCDMLGDDPETIVGGAMASFNVLPLLKKVQVPTLITSGRHDSVVAPREAIDIAHAFPPGVAQLQIFEHSSHRPWVEERALYFKKLDAFLGQPSPSTR